MKISKKQLRQIIKEEYTRLRIRKMLNETSNPDEFEYDGYTYTRETTSHGGKQGVEMWRGGPFRKKEFIVHQDHYYATPIQQLIGQIETLKEFEPEQIALEKQSEEGRKELERMRKKLGMSPKDQAADDYDYSKIDQSDPYWRGE